jgi:hypothetical protein
LKITSSIKGTPRPPALLGQPMQFQPARAHHAVPVHAQVHRVVLVAGAAAPLEALEAAREVLGQPRAHLLAEGLLLGGELEVHGAALAQHGRHALAVVLRAAQQRAAALRALEVEVRGVLPGEADAAVDLDALARAVEERVGAVGLGAAGRFAQLARPSRR